MRNGNESDKFRIDLSQKQYLKDFDLVGGEWEISGGNVSLKVASACCLELQVTGSGHHREESHNNQTASQDFSPAIQISVASSSSRC